MKANDALDHYVGQIKQGADQIIGLSAQTSKKEPYLAIAQILLAAACLAKTIDMPKDDLWEAFDLAVQESYDG